MMFDPLSPLNQGHAASADYVGDVAQVLRLARVVSVNLTDATLIASLGTDDEESETAPVSWGAMRAGKTIVWSPPSVGEQILLFCPGGDLAQAIAIGALYCDEFNASGRGVREFVRMGDGAEFGYDADASHYDITLPKGATMSVTSDGGITITGDVTLEGDLVVHGAIFSDDDITSDSDVMASGVSLKNHVHEGVSTGAETSGIPEQ